MIDLRPKAEDERIRVAGDWVLIDHARRRYVTFRNLIDNEHKVSFNTGESKIVRLERPNRPRVSMFHGAETIDVRCGLARVSNASSNDWSLAPLWQGTYQEIGIPSTMLS